MKKLRLAELKGFSSIFVLVGMLLVAIALPLATKLVQQSQENRSSAAAPSASSCTSSSVGSAKCSDGAIYKCTKGTATTVSGAATYYWKKYTPCTYGCGSGSTSCYQCNKDSDCGSNKDCIGHKCVSKCNLSGKYYSDGSKTCNGNVKYVCDAGKWSTTTCDCGCSSGSCQSKDSFYYYDEGKTSTACVSAGSYCDADKCKSAKGKTCYSSKSSCESANIKPVTVPVTGITVNRTSASLLVGSYVDITATVLPNDASNKSVSWSSSDSSIAKVSDSGRITGVKSGTAKVTAKTSNGKTATVSIDVKAAPTDSCKTAGGTCRATCGSNEKIGGDSTSCRPAVCCIPSTTTKENGECNSAYNGKTLTSRPTDAQACTKGGVYWVNPTASSGSYVWKCQGVNGGSDANCTATLKTSCSADGGSCVGSASICTGNLFGTVLGTLGCSGSTPTCCKVGASCTSKGGTCVTSGSGVTSGISCKISSTETGTTNLSYTCGTAQVCCLPGNVPYSGKCTTYSTGASVRPDTACSSGTVSWTDSTAADGDYNWTCKGSNDSVSTDDVTCSATITGSTSSNSSSCKNKGGFCTTYSTALANGSKCIVPGYATVGKVVTGLCSGDSKTVCCSGVTTPTSSGGGNNNGGGGTPTTPDEKVPATKITLDPTTLPLAIGASGMINATLEPADSTDSITWTSSDPAKATVNNGLVTGVAVGTAVITAKTDSGKTATANVTVAAAGTAKISFKFSLRGIKPSSECFDKLGNLKIDISSRTNVYQLGLSSGFTVLSGETNTYGDQVFKVTALALDSKFANVGTDNYLKIKGPFHIKRRMCLNNQSSKLSETTTCNISLTSDTVYDFSEYTLLAGDVNMDGVINSIDYSYVKTRLNAGADVSCGREGDLNLDGVVNSGDASLIKEALSSKDDE